MDIEVTREALVRELALARRLGERKTTIPVYSYALIDADFGEARITATDGDSALETGCSASVHVAGRALVPVRPLHEMARNASAETVRLTLAGDRISVIIGAFKSKLGTLPADDFPRGPEWPKDLIPLPLVPLRSALEKTRFVVEAAGAKLQGYMNGALLTAEDKRLLLVATDGRRVTVSSLPLDVVAPTALLPRKALDDLAALLANEDEAASIGYAQADGRAFFEVGARRLATNLLGATFPNWKQVIPKNGANAAEVDRDAWLGVLRRVSLVATDAAQKVRLDMDKAGTLTATLASQEIGDATETLPAVVDGAGWSSCFDVGYLADFLAAIDGGLVTFRQENEKKGGKLTASGGGVDSTYVLMPMVE